MARPILAHVQLEVCWVWLEASVASIRGRIGYICTKWGYIGDKASLYSPGRRCNFTGQARRCEALVSGHGRGPLQGRHPTVKSLPTMTERKQAVRRAEQVPRSMERGWSLERS